MCVTLTDLFRTGHPVGSGVEYNVHSRTDLIQGIIIPDINLEGTHTQMY